MNRSIKGIIILCIMATMMVSFTSCAGSKANPKIQALGEGSSTIQRIAITNSRYAGRYTVIDSDNIKRIQEYILKAKDAAVDSKLDPDFVIEFYDDTKNVASFKYIAGIDDEATANLIDSKGNLYHVKTSIEDEFMKRLMKRDGAKNVPEYYISLIKLLIEKSGAKSGDTIVVDISKDYAVTRAITSLEQQSILNSIDDSGIKISFPSETNNYNYLIKIITSKFNEDNCTASASIKDKTNTITKFDISGSFQHSKWEYHIKYR